MKELFLIIFVFVFLKVDAQNNTFMLSLQDSSSYGLCVEKTYDNGYIVGGSKGNYGLISKVDSLGNSIWSTSLFGGTHLRFWDITTSGDQNYVLTGEYFNSNSTIDLLYVKLDQNGDTVATRTLNINGTMSGLRVNATSDSGVVIAGAYQDAVTNLPFLITVKYDRVGNIDWSKLIGLSIHGSIKQTKDGGYVVVGNYTDGFVLVKLDSSGHNSWNHYYHASPSITFGFNDIIENNQGFMIYASFLGAAVMVKIDSLGNIIWSNYYSGINRSYPPKMIQSFDNCYVASSNESYNGHIIKIDSTGNLLWAIYLPTAAFDIVQASDSGYLVVGVTPLFPAGDQKLEIIKTLSDGTGVLCFYSDTNVTVHHANILEDSVNLTVTSASAITNSFINISHPILNFDTTCILLNTSVETKNHLNVFPNPSDGKFYLSMEESIPAELRIFDLYGKVVFYQKVFEKDISVNLKGLLLHGIYYLTLQEHFGYFSSQLIIY